MTIRVVAALASVLVVSAGLTGTGSTALAVSASTWDPGYIISDATFFNSSSMSQQQIQDFLVAQEPSCAALAGMPCMRNYTTTSTSRAPTANGRCAAYAGAAVEYASQVIYKVAQACGINPQVLLVLLQKEQRLVTATSPTAGAYKIATGYGCPDTAACDTQYYGFYNQLYSAAYQFKTYTQSPESFNFRPGTRNIQFHPNSACGSSAVNIKNLGTSALYNYTPYQPDAAALANLAGSGDECSSYGNRNFWVFFNNWFGSPVQNSNPIGNYESTTALVGGKIQVAGWALDPDTTAPIEVHIYVNGAGTRLVADIPRPDVGTAYGLGNLHGFSASVSSVGSGPQQVCAYAINVGSGLNVEIGCRTVTALTGDPIGVVDSLVAAAGTIAIRGWALDLDSVAPARVHTLIDGVDSAITADGDRPDIGKAFAGYGSGHGFSTSVKVSPGAHSVCVYVVNVGAGSNSTIFCQTINVFGGAPTGVLDSVVVSPGSITAAGWALDPDTVESIRVHVYVDSASAGFTADGSRPDIANAFPGYGAQHGFIAKMAATPGTHNVCFYGINLSGGGGNPLLGCRVVTAMSGSPIGVLDSVIAAKGAITSAGWTYDPDTADSIQVRLVIDGAAVSGTANGVRPDIAAAFPAYGAPHGFIQTTPAAAGSHTVCAYGVNTGPGADALFGCRTVTL
ncbi:MAG: hypothetical protein H7201_02335 [Candidatus Saccharibacteria bacterium]|nr:hypothetical protein [Microbacteriaceae bacterium]